jgi:hypothetical protein
MIEKGDIVQINPDEKSFGGCLVIVDEVKAWGVLGYVPYGRAQCSNVFYCQHLNGTFELVGKAKWALNDERYYE